jgi:hypothetical protein
MQLGINVIWYDAYCQQYDEISEIKSTFNYQMPYPNTEEMSDSIYSKSKPLQIVNIWNEDIDNEINDSCPTILITNIINTEHYDL